MSVADLPPTVRKYPFIALDPGQSTGVAVFGRKDEPLTAYRVQEKHPENNWKDRVDVNCVRLATILRTHQREQHVNTVVCELPCFFESEGGLAVANQNSLVKLAYMVGAYSHVVCMEGMVFYPIAVNEWKGNLPKEVVNKRIVRKIGLELCEELKLKADMWDAVGLGLWWRNGKL